MNTLTERPVWQALVAHQREIATQQMRDWFTHDPHRFNRYSLQVDDILFDYSRHRVTDQTIALLLHLAHTAELTQQIRGLFAGDQVNQTEKRAALHTALRDKKQTRIEVNGVNIAPAIASVRQQMQEVVTRVHAQAWRGVTGQPITHVVNLGVGGSALGPMMCTQALKAHACSMLQCFFLSHVDEAHVAEILAQINPATTLFIISSKSFTTLETMTNARVVCQWLKEKLGQDARAQQFIAVTAAPEKALAWGIPYEHILPLWDWVGGRYSVWSAVGLPLALSIGHTAFDAFLEGAYAMDQHFLHADFAQNMPVLLALFDIWYTNFFNSRVHAIVPYGHLLRDLVTYLQQVGMESNGKSVNQAGQRLDYTTSPVLFGGEGIHGQHAYHQLLHQGQQLIPVDFILVGSPTTDTQAILMASGLAQATALMQGKTYAEAHAALLAAHYSIAEADALAPHCVVPGNQPSNILLLNQLTPKSLGALLAFYEHKVFVQGAIWQINSFDQWGVELGKQLLPAILHHLQGTPSHQSIDAATAGLIAHFKKVR